jgi:hypothetical protein
MCCEIPKAVVDSHVSCSLQVLRNTVFFLQCVMFLCFCWPMCGSGSSVGIATDYGLDGPGIESGWGRDFSYTSRPALGPTQPPL